jgi:hypothetical protein
VRLVDCIEQKDSVELNSWEDIFERSMHMSGCLQETQSYTIGKIIS